MQDLALELEGGLEQTGDSTLATMASTAWERSPAGPGFPALRTLALDFSSCALATADRLKVLLGLLGRLEKGCPALEEVAVKGAPRVARAVRAAAPPEVDVIEE